MRQPFGELEERRNKAIGKQRGQTAAASHFYALREEETHQLSWRSNHDVTQPTQTD